MEHPLISVITPFSRSIKELKQLLRDFNNQTLPKNYFEHLIISDGKPSDEIIQFMDKNCPPYCKFIWIEKDIGNMKIAPGTKPRNYGISIASGDYCVFCDDDDRYHSEYLEKLLNGMGENTISVVQMTCSEKRMFRDGDPTRIRLVPEVGLPSFPIICHVGTPCVMMPKLWALENPWQHEPEHDFRFIKRIVEKYKPQISFQASMMIDVDGLVLRGLKDWVSHPPFWRE